MKELKLRMNLVAFFVLSVIWLCNCGNAAATSYIQNDAVAHSEYKKRCSMRPVYLQNSYVFDFVNWKVIKPSKSELKQAQKIYKSVKKLKKGKTLIYKNVSEKRFERLMNIVNAKYFPYASLEYGGGYDERYGGNYSFIPYRYAQAAIKNNNQLKKQVKQIIDSLGITKNTTEYDAIVILNEFMVKEYSYHEDNNNSQYNSSLAMLLTKEGVCHNYARCFQVLAQYCGIKTGYIHSLPMNHAYNMVQLGGEELYIDVCWNDDGSGQYKWMLLTKPDLKKTHSITMKTYYFNP